MVTQEQIAAQVKRLREPIRLNPWTMEPVFDELCLEAADMLEQLAADLLTVCKREAAMIARYDAKLDALEPAPDAPVTVSSTEQDLGALVEHFKAKAEKAYADGVKDAAKVAEYEAEYVPLKPGDMTRAILALLTEKDE